MTVLAIPVIPGEFCQDQHEEKTILLHKPETHKTRYADSQRFWAFSRALIKGAVCRI